MLDKEKDKEGLTVLGRTLKEIEAGLERAFEEFLQEYPDISREEAQKAWKAAGAPSRVEPWRRSKAGSTVRSRIWDGGYVTDLEGRGLFAALG